MAFVLGILLLVATAVTEIAKDLHGYEMPVYLKYGALAGSFIAFAYDHWSKRPYEVRIRQTDWTKTHGGHTYTIPSHKHRKGVGATCVVFQENGNARQPVGTGLEYSDTGDIVVRVNMTPELIAVVS